MSTAPLVDTRKDDTGHAISYKTVALKDGNIWLAENFNYFMQSPQNDLCQGWSWSGEEMEARSNGCYYAWYCLKPQLVGAEVDQMDEDFQVPEIIPAGWHVPTVDEWKNLITCYGGTESAYHKLGVGGSSGLNLALGGCNYFTQQNCGLYGELGAYWAISEGDNKEFAASLYLHKEDNTAKILYEHKHYLFNVRLVKDK